MSMETRILCVARQPERLACFVTIRGGRPAVSAGTPGAKERVEAVLAAILEIGIRVREERLAGLDVGVDFVAVTPEDPRYLEGLAHGFRLRGWQASLYLPDRAEAWRRLQVLPLEDGSREDLLARLGGLDDKALRDLSDILAKAERELAAIPRP
jgi:hypothetical protein